jgi:predicted Zn-dependent protease
MQRRLNDVALPLLIAAADSCPFERDSTYGFMLKDEQNQGDIKDHTSASAPAGSVVAYVHPQLAAASAGLGVGDRVVQVNATSVENDGAENVMRLVRRLTAAKIQPLQLQIEREGKRRTVTMWALPACQFSVGLIESDLVNGFSNGRQVALTTAAMRAFVWDDELAWIVAHEIGHNILNHVQNVKLQMMLNSFLHATVGTASSSVKVEEPLVREAQADYVGSYLMARAGYDLDAIWRVWEKYMKAESQQPAVREGIGRVHPTTMERLAAFEQTMKEIETKRRRGEPLQPRLEPAP